MNYEEKYDKLRAEMLELQEQWEICIRSIHKAEGARHPQWCQGAIGAYSHTVRKLKELLRDQGIEE